VGIFESVVDPVVDATAIEHARLRNAVRARLLVSGTSVTPSDIASATGRSPEAVRRWIERKRKAGRLVAVTHSGDLYIPSVQLDEAFELSVTTTSVVSDLVAAGMDDWAVWTWLETPNGWLDDEHPATLLRQGRHDEVRRAVSGLLQA